MATTTTQQQKRKTNGVTNRAGLTGRETAKIDKRVRQREAETGGVMADLGITPPWNTFSDLRKLDFGQLCEQRQRLDDEIKFRTEKKKELDDEISAALALAGVEKVSWEDRPVQIVHKEGSSRIEPHLLLSAGVDADTIAACTTKGNPSSYLLFGRLKKS